MTARRIDIGVGLGTVAFGLFMGVVGIPYGIDAPRNVRNLLLSPYFWPSILAGLMVVCGLLLALSAYHAPERPEEPRPVEAPLLPGFLRVAAFGVLVFAYFRMIPLAGMVWTSMAAFIGFAAITQRGKLWIVLACAIVLPLVLYVFFYHVAGVAIPQGRYIRLP